MFCYINTEKAPWKTAFDLSVFSRKWNHYCKICSLAITETAKNILPNKKVNKTAIIKWFLNLVVEFLVR